MSKAVDFDKLVEQQEKIVQEAQTWALNQTGGISQAESLARALEVHQRTLQEMRTAAKKQARLG